MAAGTTSRPSPRRPASPALARAALARPGASLRAEDGFTLLEVMLALALLTVMAGFFVLNQEGLLRSQTLPEGAERFQAVLRMARAESANQGRRLRLSFEVETLAPVIEWEFDPLGSPGVFAPYKSGLWENALPADLVQVASCGLTGPSAYQSLDSQLAQQAAESGLCPVTFYPDGTSDSASITLTGVRAGDTRMAIIDLNGLTGSITCRIMTASQYQDYVDLQQATVKTQ